MWDGDRRWLPMLLEGKKLKGPIVFGRDNNMVDKMDLTTVDTVLESEHLARIDLYINGWWTYDLLQSNIKIIAWWVLEYKIGTM